MTLLNSPLVRIYKQMASEQREYVTFRGYRYRNNSLRLWFAIYAFLLRHRVPSMLKRWSCAIGCHNYKTTGAHWAEARLDEECKWCHKGLTTYVWP